MKQTLVERKKEISTNEEGFDSRFVVAILDVVSDNLQTISKEKMDRETAERINEMFNEILNKYSQLNLKIPPYNSSNRETIIEEIFTDPDEFFLQLFFDEAEARTSLNKVFKVLDTLAVDITKNDNFKKISEAKNPFLNLTKQILAALLFLGNNITFVAEKDAKKYGDYVQNVYGRVFKCAIPHVMGHGEHGLGKPHTHLGYTNLNLHVLISK